MESVFSWSFSLFTLNTSVCILIRYIHINKHAKLFSYSKLLHKIKCHTTPWVFTYYSCDDQTISKAFPIFYVYTVLYIPWHLIWKWRTIKMIRNYLLYFFHNFYTAMCIQTLNSYLSNYVPSSYFLWNS